MKRKTWANMTCKLAYISVFIMLNLGIISAHATIQHPMDPLEDTEILAAANILLKAGVANPGAVFQSIEPRRVRCHWRACYAVGKLSVFGASDRRI